jgi:hypothetical protein
MVALSLSESEPRTAQPNIALLAIVAWLAIVAQLLWLSWSSTSITLGDTDDAMRLLEVREFLAGRSWFDLHEARLQPPAGYDTHWSRLIDAGLAALFLLFHAFTDTAMAERLMRVAWPLLWLLPVMAGTLAIARRLGGSMAGVVCLLLLLFGLPAFMQFKPGRIDHHSVQITLAVITLACAIWSDRVRWAAAAAGISSGLALGIGFESIALIVLAAALMAVRYARDAAHAAALARYGAALAASTAAVFAISVAPSHWRLSACDAMAINTAAPVALGGIALAIAGRWGRWLSSMTRWAAIAGVGALTAVGFVLIEPRCVKGPLAMADPAVLPIWLAHILEARSYFATAREDVVFGIGIAAWPVAAIMFAIVQARSAAARRDDGYWTIVGAMLIAIGMTLVAVRATPYMLWLGMPIIAAGLPRLFNVLRVKTLPARALIAIPFTPLVLSSLAFIVTVALSLPVTSKPGLDPDAERCFENKSYAAFSQLPTGLIVSDVDFGAHLLALTPHSVLGAPYHRLSYGIIDSHRAFASRPDDAHALLRELRADYLVTCGPAQPKTLSEAQMAASLFGQLKAGHVPDWLVPVPGMEPFEVYRIKR